jgi:hypothetical protein
MRYPKIALLPFGIPASTASRYGFVALLLVAQAGMSTAFADNPTTAINVDASANRRPINPNIYGQNWASPSEISALNTPVNRYGGNANSRYNWQIDAHSAGSDWYFETYSDGDGTGTPGGSVDKSIVDTRSAGNGVEPMITIPMLDYLAKLSPNRSTLAGFSVKKYGAQQKTDPYNSDAGNGIGLATGKNITGNDPLDTGVANSPDIQKAWVQHLVSKFGNATAPTGVKYYILDNEPSVWTGTHRDVHPTRAGYDEMYNKVVSYASAIRSADPSAQIIGIEEWDWWAMYVSGIDQGGGNDYASHGNVRYYPWLLQKLYSYKQQTGVQLVDIMSVHGYTDMDFSSTGGDDTLAAQQIRNRHTRILWDPNYKTPFWWGNLGINGGVINWIPTLRSWVDTYYPGLKIAFTEYSWGNEANLNGATTQADVLGIYGREGLDMANRWGTGSGTVTFLASKIYRNYDGNNSTFGDTSVSATIANPDNLSAFAAVRGSDGALTVMVINKQQGSTPVTVNLAGFTAKATAQAWQIYSAAQTSITQLADVSVNNNTLATTVPSQSITLFVLPAALVNLAPAITTQPVSQTITAGSSVTFTVAASGSPTPTFQWSKGTTIITGATSPSYAISSPSSSDAGSYSVTISNSAGSVTSNLATLTVIEPPSDAVITITVE